MTRTSLTCAIYTRKSSEDGLEQDFNPDCPLANFGDFEASYGGLVGMVRWVGF
jgi:hypothetical protein